MNLCEAIESGKRYNRAIRANIWPEEVYVYADREGRLFMNETAEGEKHKPVSIGEEDLIHNSWELSCKAPYYGPAGVLTRERAMLIVADMFETIKANDTLNDEVLEKLIQPIMMVANGTIAFVEEQNSGAERDKQEDA